MSVLDRTLEKRPHPPAPDNVLRSPIPPSSPNQCVLCRAGLCQHTLHCLCNRVLCSNTCAYDVISPCFIFFLLLLSVFRYHAEYRVRPLLWSSGGKKYLNERTVGVQQNAFHFVANPRANVPAALGGILWNGCDDQSLSVRFPIYTVSTELAPTWVESAESNRTVFKMRSSHWAFNLVANFAYFQWSAVAPVVQGKIVAYEEMLFKNVAEKDTAVLAMIKNGGASKEDVAKTLTEFSVQAGDKLVDDWNTFFGELFVRFSDGFDASVMPRAAAPGAPTGYARGGTSTVQVKEPGYDQSWYDRIAADAGEKYHVPGSGDGGGDGDAVPLLNPRLSKDRLRFM